jgi:MFS family permease
MAVRQSFMHLLLTAFFVGFSNTMYYVGVGTVLMEYTPSTLLGRVISTRQLALGFVRVVSPLLFGALAESVGIRSSVLSMALIGAVGTAAVIVWLPAVRSLDARPLSQSRPPALWAWTVGSVDPEIEPVPQYRMNVVSLLSVLAVFVALGLQFGRLVLVVAFALGLSVYVGIIVRRRWGVGQGL